MRVSEELERESYEFWFSPISVREILSLAEKARISFETDDVKGVREIFRRIPLREAAIN
jgi:hypothetical protein